MEINKVFGNTLNSAGIFVGITHFFREGDFGTLSEINCTLNILMHRTNVHLTYDFDALEKKINQLITVFVSKRS